jgi:hypothetical protein
MLRLRNSGGSNAGDADAQLLQDEGEIGRERVISSVFTWKSEKRDSASSPENEKQASMGRVHVGGLAPAATVWLR